MRIDHEDKDKSKLHKKLLKEVMKVMQNQDAIILSDYDKGVIKPNRDSILKLKPY